MKAIRIPAIAAALLASVSLPANAQEAEALATQLANPVAALISVPVQVNYDSGGGSRGDTWVTNVQPVIPTSLNSDWNVVSRTILPIINQQGLAPAQGSRSGLGDIVQSFFFTPKAPTAGGWIWGVGPVLVLPTGSDAFSGHQWGVGPTAVALRQDGAWSYGLLTNYVRGVSNSGLLANTNAALLQPFVTKNLGKGASVSGVLESSYDWNRGGWTVPVTVSYGQVLKLGPQLISVGAGARYYLEKPLGGHEWGLRASVTLLFPR